ncbi:glycoside hydrolase family 16 protein [Dankookia rubra]|uniref:Glycoside hydrolase family 16 protein n=1 Tax=Dankookia rubra TaxID=1442381 RepID=A0A4V3A9E1_9PROT|nr:glycoside hydrolase family 16 protein [Dankookia rubra]
MILDFVSGVDRIRLEGSYALPDFAAVRAAMTQSGADVVLDLGNGEILVLRNTQVDGFRAADFQLPIDPAHPGMHRTFSEDFNGFSASASGSGTVWKTSLGVIRQDRTLANNKEAGYYTDSSVGSDPFSLADGVLDITASPGSNPLNLPYNSGVITTATSFAQRYGYFEARLDLPAGKGFWPAFWLLPASGAWPPEIDIMEALGQDPTTAYASLHSGTSGNSTIPVKALYDLSTGFHTYGLDWKADTIAWFIDGIEVARAATPADMNQPMYMVLNLAVGGTGSWAGATDPSMPTEHLLIDYVRAWQYGDGIVTGPGDVVNCGGTYTLKADGVSDLYDFTKAKAALIMDASGLSTSGTHTVWGSPLGSTVRGGPGNVNFSGGISDDSFSFGSGVSRAQGGAGNDTFVLTKGCIAPNDQIIDFHVDLGDGGEHDLLQLVGFSAAARLDFVVMSGGAQAYRIVDGDYVSPNLLIQVANGSARLGSLDIQFG